MLSTLFVATVFISSSYSILCPISQNLTSIHFEQCEFGCHIQIFHSEWDYIFYYSCAPFSCQFLITCDMDTSCCCNISSCMHGNFSYPSTIPTFPTPVENATGTTSIHSSPSSIISTDLMLSSTPINSFTTTGMPSTNISNFTESPFMEPVTLTSLASKIPFSVWAMFLWMFPVSLL